MDSMDNAEEKINTENLKQEQDLILFQLKNEEIKVEDETDTSIDYAAFSTETSNTHFVDIKEERDLFEGDVARTLLSNNDSRSETISQNIIYVKRQLTLPEDDETNSRLLESKQQKHLHECAICNKGFKFKRQLYQHISNVHSGETLHTCTDCGKQYHHLKTFKNHTRAHLEGLRCKICGKKFSHITSLKRHMLMLHGTMGDLLPEALETLKSKKDFFNLTCETCNKNCTNLAEMKAHLKDHVKDKLYKCVVCHKEFETKFQEDSHMAEHRSEYFKKKTLESIKQNMSTNENIKIIKTYSCKVCRSVYLDKVKFQRHVLLHYKYSCHICHKKFVRNGDLKNHAKLHTKIHIEHECNQCCKLLPSWTP